MRLRLITRKWEECSSGYEFYVCRSNNFQGCCSVDPCALDECPDSTLIDTDPTTVVKSIIRRPTTIASVGPPLRGTPSPTYTDRVSTTATPTTAPATSVVEASPKTVTVTAGTSAAPNQIPSSNSDNISNDGMAGKEAPITPGAIGGIAGAIGVILVIIIAWFILRRKGKNNKGSAASSERERKGSNDSGKIVVGDDKPTTVLENPFDSEDVFAPFGGRFDRPSSHHTRYSAPSSLMKNHPVSPVTRHTMSMDTPRSRSSYPSAMTPEFGSPKFGSRDDASTPELEGSPKRAAVAELASPGLPNIVQITGHNRQSIQRFKPYGPDLNLSPVSEGTADSLRATLNVTPEERTRGRHVASWSHYDGTT